MVSADEHGEENARLQARLREVEARLRAREVEWAAADRQRQTAERLLRAAFAQGPEAAAISRLRDGLVVDANQEWLDVTGHRREEAVGRTLVEIGHWPDQAACDAAMAPLRSGKRLRELEVVVQVSDGRKRLVRMNGSRLDVGDEPHALIYLKDITAERMAEEAMRTGELVLGQAVARLNQQLGLHELTESLARVGHWIASPDGQTIEWSMGLRQMVGLPAIGPALSNAEARSYIHPDDLPLFLRERERMDGRTVEFRLRRADGALVRVRSSMHRQSYAEGSTLDFGILVDMTAESEVRQALQDKLSFIEKITSRVPDVLFQYQRRRDGSVWFPFVSESVHSLVEIDPERVRQNARLLFDKIDADDRPGLFASMRAAHADGTTWQYDFRVRLADGSVRWIHGNSITVREHDGELVSYGALSDYTERKFTEDQLKESEARFRSLTDLSSDWYWEIDEDFRFTRFVGYRAGKAALSQQDSLGKTRWELGALNLSQQDWDAHRQVLQAHLPFRDLELQRLDAGGRPYWVSISGTPFFDEGGHFRGYRGIGRDISMRKNAEEQTQRLAFYDTLTGLPNRRLLIDRLVHAQATSARSGQFGALLFIDLDNFKDLNDTLGHDVGDRLLEQVGRRLVACIREGDTAARFGGDEFVVMLEDLSDSDAEAAPLAERVAGKILSRLGTPYELVAGRPHSSTPSIGIALFRGTTPGVDELLKRADVAMYQAKAAGRNTLRFFDPQVQATVLARSTLDADLRQALPRGELALYFQPLVDVDSRVAGYEALLRWRHPQRGLVPPDEFIPQAEQSGLILSMGEWVLRCACSQLVRWAAEPATRTLGLSVNVSARQFRQPDFVERVLAVLDETGVAAHRLKLELTESVLISDVEDAILKMGRLRERGVRFALDDFGTGYSSLSYLKRLPLDQLKIDQSFVRGVLNDPNDAAIVRTILALADSLDLLAVAEGVETEGQRQFLLASGCTLFQGYLFGRPAPLPGG